MRFELHMFQVKERVRQLILRLGIKPQYFMVRAEICLKSDRFLFLFTYSDKIVFVRLFVLKKNSFCEFWFLLSNEN